MPNSTFGIMYGSGPASVAESVNLALLEQSIETGEPFEPCTVDDAKGHIAKYFSKFPQLKRWIDSSHDQIRQYGFIYSFFGRKRRLRNYKSTDRGVVAGEVRSGFNAIIQSASSDALLLGVIDADRELEKNHLDAEIVGLVHDSVIAIVREDQIEEYNELLDRNIQKSRYNWDENNGALTIAGCPIGIESDSEEGGSRDYSCGKMEKVYPFIAAHDDHDESHINRCKKVIEEVKEGNVEYDKKSKEKGILDNLQKTYETLQEMEYVA